MQRNMFLKSEEVILRSTFEVLQHFGLRDLIDNLTATLFSNNCDQVLRIDC